jgi:hypothetical protein
MLPFVLESSHLEQQLEEANSVRRELDDAFRQIKAHEKQIEALQQEREELNKVNILNRLESLLCSYCRTRILKAFITNYNIYLSF